MHALTFKLPLELTSGLEMLPRERLVVARQPLYCPIDGVLLMIVKSDRCQGRSVVGKLRGDGTGVPRCTKSNDDQHAHDFMVRKENHTLIASDGRQWHSTWSAFKTVLSALSVRIVREFRNVLSQSMTLTLGSCHCLIAERRSLVGWMASWWPCQDGKTRRCAHDCDGVGPKAIDRIYRGGVLESVLILAANMKIVQCRYNTPMWSRNMNYNDGTVNPPRFGFSYRLNLLILPTHIHSV